MCPEHHSTLAAQQQGTLPCSTALPISLGQPLQLSLVTWKTTGQEECSHLGTNYLQDNGPAEADQALRRPHASNAQGGPTGHQSDEQDTNLRLSGVMYEVKSLSSSARELR